MWKRNSLIGPHQGCIEQRLPSCDGIEYELRKQEKNHAEGLDVSDDGFSFDIGVGDNSLLRSPSARRRRGCGKEGAGPTDRNREDGGSALAGDLFPLATQIGNDLLEKLRRSLFGRHAGGDDEFNPAEKAAA